ncbi:hypothetical protein HMPREF1337_03058 [Enterococcus faecalis ERV65]|uniref:Uncharacterized protein n=1 Tax=Enterococcus faecalis ERV63 TaxID=1134793 RepID=A0AAV3GL63_ENTFL|nr:hypothetical protein HMPREF0348_0504 [Enterococcus faecalis TX0104]EJU88151.1 hypothetical protein HMPREF1328_01970 [Enterococcus faecalis ERV103]EJU89399.1 hypothetical protein HMPREF1329_01174 [Enterococcus faecalis ERV116]EJU94913.1 hypothetical protein HMPREF1330_02433 [Enterococcus faecalis ERV129]EJU95786.1 hypothetical protein HMPREF1332_02863 [Enterococcus faecalis ERV31]EJU98509.1 hypothetical protein HMPREF1331_01796 [Enterococcus faecalis ERV25]EJV04604.1 hypothetical protein HM
MFFNQMCSNTKCIFSISLQPFLLKNNHTNKCISFCGALFTEKYVTVTYFYSPT